MAALVVASPTCCAAWGCRSAIPRAARKPTAPTGFADAQSLATECDLLFVTAAGGAGTKALVDGNVLRALGPDGILVNVARGPVVDSQALADALCKGMIGAAGLDVFDDEPNVPQCLLDAPHCVLTPHIASATTQARRAMAQLVLDNVAAHVAGRPLPTPYKD